eukprot:TRINITY_DN77227_c0_g1_i1.p1 TRINITY_DN77227_c0_g1~~TRINITY_DN77227_c0_g1_i1.p1  ORF type:complete len:1148 (+),score=233.85 TRINITY_DN77227_c0_g1_i1:39-3482(+)
MALQGSAAELATAEVQPGAHFGPERDKYEIGKELGHGGASRVFACHRTATGEQFAVKAVDLRRLCLLGDLDEQLSRLDSEVGILQELCHERIVNLRGFHKTDNWYFLVMELVAGGELFDLIVKSKSLSEAEARHIFLQLLEGVGYMHDRGVIHRDLKPENILVAASRPAEPPANGLWHDVKIADFGLSKAIGGGASEPRTRVGTPQYWAPEVLDVSRRGGTYDQAADFWGLGAILFVMLCGRYPFDGQKQALDDQIRTAAYSMTGSRWRGISEAAKSLVRGLLRVNPVDRLSLDECLRHPWVTGEPMHISRRPMGTQALPKAGKKYLEVPTELHGQQVETQQLRGQRLHPQALHEQVPEEHEEEHEERPCTPPALEPTASQAQSTSCYSVSDIDAGGSCSRVVSTPNSEKSDDADDRPSRKSAETVGKKTHPEQTVEDRSISSVAFGSFLCGCFLALPRWIADAASGKDLRIGRRQAWAMGALFIALWVHSSLISRNQTGGLVPGEIPHVKQPQPVLVAQPGSSRPEHAQATIDSPTHSSLPGNFDMEGPRREESREQGNSFGRRQQAPLFHFDGFQSGPEDSCTDQKTIFRLNELLKLQVSIAGSLEMANLAFRHADGELAEATRAAYQQARKLFERAASTVSRYAEVASQVSNVVLPDLALAIDEQEPALAAGLLDVVKSWVAEMKKDSDVMRGDYSALQSIIVSLAERAQRTKQEADIHLAKAVRDAAGEAAAVRSKRRTRDQRKAADSPSSTQPPASSMAGENSPNNRALTSHSGHTGGVNVCQSWHKDPAGVQAGAREQRPPSGTPHASHVSASNSAAEHDNSAAAAPHPAATHLNSLTQRLFEQLSELGRANGAQGASDALVAAGSSAAMGSLGSAAGDVEAWQRNVIDLLFLAPGIVPALPASEDKNMSTALGFFSGNSQASGVGASGMDLQVASIDGLETGMEEEDEEQISDDVAEEVEDSEDEEAVQQAANASSANLAVVRYVETKGAKATAEKAARSSASLLRALRELRRVDSILEGCFVFWANMDGTVQRLGQMKEHAERLVNFASSKPKLRERFEQRMKEYASFWSALEQLCRQYSLDHQAVSSKMRDFIREVSDAADLVDTAESARAGVRAAAVPSASASSNALMKQSGQAGMR